MKMIGHLIFLNLTSIEALSNFLWMVVILLWQILFAVVIRQFLHWLVHSLVYGGEQLEQHNSQKIVNLSMNVLHEPFSFFF